MGKEKVAISLDSRLLKRVDASVDGTTVKSRSHAIETLLMRALGEEQAPTAVVLAGGYGRRMGELAYKMPKGMVEVGGKPVLQHIVEWLRANGVRHVILSIGHLGGEIEAYFGDGKHFGMQIAYARETEPLGTAGPLSILRERLGDLFVVLNGDVLCDFDLRAMLSSHRRSRAAATMALRAVREPGSYGVVEMEGERITKFEERARRNAEPGLVNAGVYAMSSRIFDFLPKRGMLERDVFPKLAEQGLLNGFVFTGSWVDVSDKESLRKAEKILG